MPVEIRIPAVLRNHVGGAKAVEANSGALREVLDDLSTRYPGIKDQVLTHDGVLNRFVNVYLNDEDVRYLDGLDTKVADDDVVSILPAVAGGSR